MVSTFLNLAISLNSAITKSNILELCRLIEILKVMNIFTFIFTEKSLIKIILLRP